MRVGQTNTASVNTMATGAAPMTVRDYVAVLLRRRWTVVLVCLMVAGAALAFSLLKTPIYEAQTRLLLGANQTTIDDGGFGQYIDPNRIQTEIQVLLGKPITDIVASQIGSAPRISATAVGGTAVIELTTSSPDAATAAKVANAYASAYITYRQKQFSEAVATQTREYSRQIESLASRIAEIEARPREPGAASPELEEPTRRADGFSCQAGAGRQRRETQWKRRGSHPSSGTAENPSQSHDHSQCVAWRRCRPRSRSRRSVALRATRRLDQDQGGCRADGP